MKVLLWLVGAALVVVLLFLVVFPWFTVRYVTDPVLDAGDGTGDPATVTEGATPFQPTPLMEVTEY